MYITPDSFIIFQHGIIKINATILITWHVMLLLVGISWFATRKVSHAITLEIIVRFIINRLKEAGLKSPEKYLPFIGTLFIFIATCGILTMIPGYIPPTASLSTTAALAISVFFAVPLYAICEKGILGYLKNYTRPVFIFLPFNIIAEFTRTLALAVRLFGNSMSAALIVGIILSVSPILFPVPFQLLELLLSMIQAYIFTILSTVFIAAATSSFEQTQTKGKKNYG